MIEDKFEDICTMLRNKEVKYEEIIEIVNQKRLGLEQIA